MGICGRLRRRHHNAAISDQLADVVLSKTIETSKLISVFVIVVNFVSECMARAASVLLVQVVTAPPAQTRNGFGLSVAVYRNLSRLSRAFGRSVASIGLIVERD